MKEDFEDELRGRNEEQGEEDEDKIEEKGLFDRDEEEPIEE